jgi:predicted aconitase
MVVIGCPHVTAAEFKEIAMLLNGKKVGPNQRLWIGMPYQVRALAKTMGYVDIVERAGGIIARSCMATIPDSPIPGNVSTVATNSFKAAHYISQLTKGRVQTIVGTLAACINAAVTGKWK